MDQSPQPGPGVFLLEYTWQVKDTDIMRSRTQHERQRLSFFWTAQREGKIEDAGLLTVGLLI